MSFLDNFFNKNHQDEQTLDIPENWDFYRCHIEEDAASYFLNFALHEIAPLEQFPDICSIKIRMNQSREDGLSSNKEFEELLKLEDTLIPELIQKHHVIYAGRLSHQHHRTFYLYCSASSEMPQTIASIMQQFPQYNYQFDIEQDTHWSIYFDTIYPDEITLQYIQNEQVVQQLQQQGDDLTLARTVEHWIYFANTEDMQHFILAVQALNFEVVYQEKIDEPTDYPYELQIAREDNVDLDSVNVYTIELWQLAQQCHADYDGWETQVMTP